MHCFPVNITDSDLGSTQKKILNLLGVTDDFGLKLANEIDINSLSIMILQKLKHSENKISLNERK